MERRAVDGVEDKTFGGVQDKGRQRGQLEGDAYGCEHDEANSGNEKRRLVRLFLSVVIEVLKFISPRRRQSVH